MRRVARRFLEHDAQLPAEGHKLVELVVGQVGWGDCNRVVDVGDGVVGSALAVGGAPTGRTRVGDSGGGGDVTPEHPAD